MEIYCLSYFSITMLRHHDHGNLQESLSEAYSLRGLESVAITVGGVEADRQEWHWRVAKSLHAGPQASERKLTWNVLNF